MASSGGKSVGGALGNTCLCEMLSGVDCECALMVKGEE